jgi:hypothetical protein
VLTGDNSMMHIRDSAYETNSSSSHSLTIAEDDLLELSFGADALRSGVISLTIAADEYGDAVYFDTKWKRFYSPENKLLYALIAAAGGEVWSSMGNDDLLPGLIDGLKNSRKLSDQKATKRVLSLLAWVREETGCGIELRFAPTVASDKRHVAITDNYGELIFPLFADASRLRQFMFSRNSFVQTGYDNETPPFEIATDDRGYEVYFASKMVDADNLEYGFTLGWDREAKSIKFSEHGSTVFYGPVEFGFELFNPFDVSGVARLHISAVSMAVPAYVSNWPEDMRDLDDDYHVTREETAKYLLNNVISHAMRVSQQSNARSILTVAPGIEPVVYEVGTRPNIPRNIYDCPSAEIDVRCDLKTLGSIRRSVKKLAKEYAS